MKILVACEESQAVTKELRRLGHEAYSCDIIECSGGHPEWHIMNDCLPLLNGRCTFRTMDESKHRIDTEWDMIIAFPPCTHLAVSGASSFEKKRKDGRQAEAIKFFCAFLNAKCQKIAIENPVGIISGGYIKKHFPELASKYNLPKKPSCIINPYEHGDPFEKRTCLWLKGLPSICPTNIVDVPPRQKLPSGKTMPAWYSKCSLRCDGIRQVVRSKTFPGIAHAMAEQWAGGIVSE